MNDEIEKYYDGFADVFLRDLSGGNARVRQVHDLYALGIARTAKRILLVGCGSGRDAWVLANRVAPAATILAIDISGNNIRMARALYPHARIEYRQADIIRADLSSQWEYIIFPDVYEHIPVDDRREMHSRLASYLTDDGRIILTCPTPWHQARLRAEGAGLQVVDEDVTLEDVQQLAKDVGGFVGFYRIVSVWWTNDYFQTIVERRDGTRPLTEDHRVAVKAHARRSAWKRSVEQVAIRTRWRSVSARLKRRRYLRRLRRAGVLIQRGQTDP